MELKLLYSFPCDFISHFFRHAELRMTNFFYSFLWFFFFFHFVASSLFSTSRVAQNKKSFRAHSNENFCLNLFKMKANCWHRAIQQVMTKSLFLQSEKLKFIENVINAIFLLNFMMNGKWSFAVHINYVFFGIVMKISANCKRRQKKIKKKRKLCNEFA